MNKKYIPLVLLLLSQAYKGQNVPSNNNYGLPQIVAPSQETFANSRINFEPSSSGDFNYSLPVYGGIKTPITFNYTSGVRIDDIGSSTGLSWQLNTAGVISRVVKDETDENKTNWKPVTVDETANLLQIKNAALTGNAIDTEYDWFNFSVADLSGSFYIDKDLNVFIESKDKVKIEIFDMNAPVAGYGKLLKFKLTDKYGTEYYFGGAVENIEKTTTQSSGPDSQSITGWSLYKIISPDKTETNFTYITETLTYYAALNAGFSVAQACSTLAGGAHYVYNDIQKSKLIQQSYRPKLISISEENKNISFIYGKARKDLFNSNAENNLLTSIEIKSGSLLIEKYNLEYQDIQSSIAATYYGLPSDEKSTTNRSFLKSLKNVTKNTNTDFSYYELEKIPARFSLNSDYYGYPNGKVNSSPFPAPGTDNNFGVFQGFSNVMPLSMLSANKSVNPLLASVGNLKQITHPTKGISEIFYEPNSSLGSVTTTVRDSYGLEPQANNCKPAFHHPKESFTFVSNGTPIDFYTSASFDVVEACNEPDDRRDWHQLTIRDETTGQPVYTTPNNQLSINHDSQAGGNYQPVNTIAGHTYKVEYTVRAALGAVSGAATISYNSRNVTTDQPIYFGGSRVSSIKESDIEGHAYTRKFYYNPLTEINNPKTSIGDYNTTYIAAARRETSKSCLAGSGTFPQMEILNIYTAYQDNMLPSFNHRKNKATYTDITEVIENKSAVERKFSYVGNTDPYIGRPPAIYNIPNTNLGELKSNLLLEENVYKFDNGQYSRIMNKIYTYDYSQIKSLKSYVFRENFAYYPDPAEDPLINISHGFYENYYGFYNLTKVKTSEYLPNNSVLTTTNTSSYSNPNHYQLTLSKTEFPDQTIQETSYSYAHEKGNQLMIDENMIGIPLETSSTQTIGISTKTLSKIETIYPKTIAEITNNNTGLVLPLSIKSYDILNTTVPTTEVTYDKYDSKGNLLQYTTKDGIPVSFLWGYNQTQPIAKVEGIAYSQIENNQSWMAAASDADALDPTQESNLLDSYERFRKLAILKDKLVTTYTYDPLIGVTSITPPSGIREVYVYDTANRLKEVKQQDKDAVGNPVYKIVKEYKYNYKN